MDWLKLNFYDIFGYLIPGSVAVGLVWVPMYLKSPDEFELSVAGAFLGVALCFAVGLVVAEIARLRVESKTYDGRRPTDWLLDRAASRIGGNGLTEGDAAERPTEARPLDLASADAYLEAAQALLGVSATIEPPLARDATALQARRLLITAGRSGYLEKFQGLQALSRGLFGACEVGGLFLLGLGVAAVLASLAPDTAQTVEKGLVLWGGLGIMVSLVWTAVEYGTPKTWTAIAAYLLRAGVLVGGFAFALGHDGSEWLPAGLAGGVIYVGRGLFREAHDRFAKAFAEETMRALIDLHRHPPKEDGA